ncbi:MAG: sugar ABC transporter ATP-binding protein [Candidatus Dormibacteraeota bacterium]|nr:sugar ABC transporter ATP-binding protein [Candidatus Dormibacteraeota bacterium]
MEKRSADPGGGALAPGEAPRFRQLRASGIAKSFGPTQAIRSASVDLCPGEVLALMGENGSGKSTLVKILAGVHQPDLGLLDIDGVQVRLRSPRAAIEAGIAAVFQEVLVAGSRPVLDNVWLGADGLFRAGIEERERRRMAEEALRELLDRPVDLAQPVEDLSLSDRQACCIVRALVRGPRILLLDEAASALDVAARGRLFEMVRRLARSGSGVVFISHRMDDVEEIADRVVVMRAGETVASLRRGEASRRDLLRLMTGDERAIGGAGEAVAIQAPGSTLLEVRGATLRPGARPIDFVLRAGELVGLAGLEGHGQDAFLQVLRGAGAGVLVHGPAGRVAVRSPHQAARAGVAYVPRDRSVDGIFETLSVRDNFALPTLAQDTRLGFVRRSSSDRRLRDHVQRLRIRLRLRLAKGRGQLAPETVPVTGDPVAVLSGGTQQKVLIARWLAAGPRVLLLNDPTRGVDLGTKHDIYQLLAELTAEGVGVVMLSTEVDELVELMDRVLVFREHEVFAELPRAALTPGQLVTAFFGQEADRA